MYPRLTQLSKSNSFFLFGARGTGKSTLLRQQFSPQECLWVDLLTPELENQLTIEPSRLREIWKHQPKPWIVIDEVQKVPKLLDVAHSMIETEKVNFALTGSSARKLKHGRANLLAGRSFTFHLFPLCQKELGPDFHLENALHYGTLPKVLSLNNDLDKSRFLRSYANTYLKEEIQSEQLIRNMEPFRKFLPVAAMSHGRPLNYAKIGRDAAIDPKSVERYFSILEETLVGFFLDSFHRSIRARQKASPKFYFFDTGIQRALSEMLEVKIIPRTSYYGEMFESFLVTEIHRRVEYAEKSFRLSYLKTADGLEIDLIIEQAGQVAFLVEIKSSRSVVVDDLSALRRLGGDFPQARRLVLCQETVGRKTDEGIEILPWEAGIETILQDL
jgi:predicted AAA+ superfamily ATPase